MDHTPPPRVIAERYELVEVIGTGGMGEVWKARDLKMHRGVAIKFLRPHVDPELEVRTRFEFEAQAASRLTHPNIVAVFDFGVDEGVPFIVMELLSGRTLAHKLSHGPLETHEVQRFGLEILSALEASHAEGILHRDLKPGNVMLTQHEVAKVADFGIAKIIEGVDMTDTGTMLGTPAYLAPERVAGEPATPATDVYSAGVVLYELLTAKKPFDADTPLGLVRAIQEEDPEPLTDARPGLDPALAAIVERAMAKDPAKRYSTAGEMAEALDGWASPAGFEDTQSLSPVTSTQGFRIRKKGGTRRRRRLAGIILAVIAVAWPVYVMTVVNKAGSEVKSPPPRPPQPASSIAAPLAEAIGRLEGTLVETGTSETLQPGVQAIRDAAVAGDQTLAGIQLAQLRTRVANLAREGALSPPALVQVLGAIANVEAQLSTITPPPRPAQPAPPAVPTPPNP